MSKRPSRVLIDMDGGIDDALAIILALRSREAEVAGITAVSGNVPVERAATNALRVLEVLNRRDVWVARGLANPLIRDPTRATNFHGKDGLGDSNLPLPKLRPHTRNALDLITMESETTRRRGLSIIATGPLTNIAAVLTKEPGIAREVDELVIMGGAYRVTEFGVGNETPVAEFNIYSDPEAAKIVFESDVRLTAVGLDVTMVPEAHLVVRDYSRIRDAKSKVSEFASRILARAMRKWRRFALHDPMAVAAKTRPSLFRFATVPVEIETRGEITTGMTVTDRRNWLPRSELLGRKVRVCRGVRAKAFKNLVLDALLAS